MKNELKMFSFKDSNVRVLLINGEPQFVAKDISDILGFSEPSAMTRTLDKDEKGLQEVQTLGGKQKLGTITEPGLYAAIFKSKRLEAKEFKRWVTHEVLPSIRKTGGYVDNDDLFIDTYLPFADDSTKLLFRTTLSTVRKQNEEIKILKPKAEVHDQLVSSGNYATMNEVAKNIGIGRNKMFEFLRTVGVCFLDGGNNIPKQSYQNEGYFKVTVKPKQMGDYIKNVYTTRVSGKGNVYLLNLVNTYGGAKLLNNMKQDKLREYVMKKHEELKKQRKHGVIKIENPDFKKKETIVG